ncbi:unnamed protein product [Candida verbasci]|uniref:Serine/threonine-protein kinase ATG1 n=1 Tax=Candida verbasci TaxID=1227364 RepID=A0A9W4TXL2_9ASCO|nr:unnamed protein product [Candida verbasci]
MKHPHIVGLLDYKQTSAHFHLVMDYCSMGDLSYFIRRRNQLAKSHPIISSLLNRYPSPEGSHGLNETLVLHFLRQLSSALEFLRDKSLVHRDIKPQNLLLCPPVHSKQDFIDNKYVGMWELPILKIADFGFARFLPSTSMAETLCGSPLYMAPEILRYEKYNAKADLWSVGAVLYEMTVGKPPFKAGNHIELLKNIEKANDKIKFPTTAQVPESLKQLIKSLLKYNPTERMSFNEFFNNSLITCDLEDSDKPLETSDMDENLFISEYISPIKESERPQFMEFSPANNGSEIRASDNEIKQIITKNSPEPDNIKDSIHASLNLNNKKEEIILEKEYVVVEKRAVEVNALADELANARNNTMKINEARRLASNKVHEEPPQSQSTFRRSSSTNQRRPSFTERRISISISPTNALSKAIGIASNRLFGSNATNDDQKTTSFATPEDKLNIICSKDNPGPNLTNDALLQKLNHPLSNTALESYKEVDHGTLQSRTTDETVLYKLESLATKSYAVNLFADVKFSQLIPSPPSIDRIDDNILNQNDMLPPKIMKTVSEEGVALYVKTLSLLAKGMSVASEWWYNQFEKKKFDEGSKPDIHVSIKINQIVQWIREKFNESLEKAEFVKLRLQEANLAIIKNESSNDEDFDNNKVVAEKLIFDRALEMSRNAAVNELVKEDLRGCELAYSTAIWMLEALLDEDDTDPDYPKLDSDDKLMVEKFIVSIGNRLSVLRKKIELV